jgi:hypothetical protein
MAEGTVIFVLIVIFCWALFLIVDPFGPAQQSDTLSIKEKPEPIAEPRRQDSTESTPQKMTQEPESSDTSTSKQSRFKFCINCGAEAILVAKFCHACGTPTNLVDTQKSEKDTSARDTPLSETSATENSSGYFQADSLPKPTESKSTKQKSRSLVVPAVIIAAALVIAALIFNDTDEENELQTCIRGVMSNETMNEAQAAILCSGLQSNQR